MLHNVLFYALCAYINLRCIQSYGIEEDAVAYMDGDIMIGGIFPIHNEVSNLLNRTNADDYICTG
ncbi:Hypothetical predicted protein, partial [Pelobates cultripes]